MEITRVLLTGETQYAARLVALKGEIECIKEQ